MAGVFLDYKPSDFEGAVYVLDEYVNRIQHRRDLMENIGAFGESVAKGRIDNGGPGPNGEKWPDWSEKYAATRIVKVIKRGKLKGKKSGHSLLRASLSLYQSLQYEVPDEETALISSNLVYAAVHQLGSASDDPHNIPARPYLGFSPDETNELSQILVDWAISIENGAVN